jgi:hypothetical protein
MQSGRHDLRRQVEVISNHGDTDTLISEVPIKMSAGKLFLHTAPRLEDCMAFMT